ncbi:MAG TPA: ABC transporter permease subunit [Candidatus Saccharimonadales bacterium]|nr:ABC transporter permease subunit [Candidatus Saccharimonadales bacterium]
MNIFLRELRAHYKGLIGWSLGMILLVAVGMAKYAALSGNGQTASQLFNALPKPFLAVMGIQGLDVNTVIGYFGVLYLYIVLMATIHAAMIGAEIISKEERDRTSEFLYPKPVARASVVTQKLLAALVNVLILNIITLVSSIFIVAAFAHNYSNTPMVIVLTTGLLFMQLLFFALGAALAGLFKNPKLPSATTTTILLATYIIWVVIDLNSRLNLLKYITPFKYFDASIIIKDGHLDPFYMILSTVIFVVLIITTYISFNKRDLKV